MLDRLFMGAAADDKLFVEDVFSTYLYTGNGSTQTITNGIDLAGKGGLVWLKDRVDGASFHALYDTARGVSNRLSTNATNAQAFVPGVNAFNSNGFGLGTTYNANGIPFASWTFRKAPKFFDVVTWTGNGVNGRQIPHSLGITPGCVIVKATSSTGNWIAQGNSMPNGVVLFNSSTVDIANAAQGYIGQRTATTFQVVGGYPDDTILSAVNATGVTYVAYLFAHDQTADGVIQCGSYTGNGSATGPVVTLGWEPQWLMIKRVNDPSSGNWQIIDNMRGMPVGTAEATLQANLANAETAVEYVSPTATGFQVTSTNTQVNANGGGYFFIAIRRGPMKTPTLGTSVFVPTKQTSTGYTQITGLDFAPDFVLRKAPGGGDDWNLVDKLRGPTASLSSNTTLGETIDTQFLLGGFLNNGVKTGTSTNGQFNGYNPNSVVFFKRAPGFFDVVAYTGVGGTETNLNHSLGVVPEMVIVKCRSSVTDGDSSFPASWRTAVKGSGANGYWFSSGLNSSNASPYSDTWSAYFTSTTTFNPFSVTLSSGSQGVAGNVIGKTYVAYLFASCPGVSKVGSYTGNGSSQTINCSFAAGARFVMIKRTDSTGDWYVWDTARGIVAGNDPHLSLNTTAAEVTSNDTIDPDSSGFVVNQVAATNVNVNAATYIYLAIA
jgi:hypothetical protein